jgi:hypothetical protein
VSELLILALAFLLRADPNLCYTILRGPSYNELAVGRRVSAVRSNMASDYSGKRA